MGEASQLMIILQATWCDLRGGSRRSWRPRPPFGSLAPVSLPR